MEKLIALRGKLDAIKAMGTNAKKVAPLSWTHSNKAWCH